MKRNFKNSVFFAMLSGIVVCIAGSAKYTGSLSFAALHECAYMVQGTTVPNTSGQPVVIDERTGTVISANFFNSGAIDSPYFDGMEFVSVCINHPNSSGQVTATIEYDVGRDDDATIKGYPQFVFGSKFGNQFETSFRYYNNNGLPPEHQWPVVASNLSQSGYPFQFANLEYISRVKGVGLPAFTSSLPDINVVVDVDEFSVQGAERDVMLESWFYDTSANADLLGVDTVTGTLIAETLNNIVGVGHPHYGEIGNLLLEMMVHLGPLSPNDISGATRNPGQYQLTENYSGKDFDGDGIDDHFDVDSHANYGISANPQPGIYSSGIDENGDGIDDADILPVTIGNYEYSIWYGTTYLTPLIIFSRETNSSLAHNYFSDLPEMDLSSEGEISLDWNLFLDFTLYDVESMLQAANVDWAQGNANPFPRMRAAGGAIGGLEIGVEPQTNASTDSSYRLEFNKLSVKVDGKELGLQDVSSPEPVRELLSPVGLVSSPVTEFIWKPVEQAAEYRLYVSSVDSNASILSPWISADELGCSDSVDSCVFYSDSELTDAQRWRVRARNPVGQSEWSVRTDFSASTVAPPFVVTELLSPVGSGEHSAPDFRWRHVENADFYRLFVADTATGETEILSGWISADSLDCFDEFVCRYNSYNSGFEFEGAKKWRIRASNASGHSEWSRRADFTAPINRAPDTVAESISPVGNLQDTPDFLLWRPVDRASEYRILLVDVDSGEQQIYSAWLSSVALGCETSDNCLYELPKNIAGRKKWRVRARNEFGGGEWSPRTDFTIVASQPPVSVTELIAPVGESAMLPAALQWQGVNDAALYKIFMVDIETGDQDIFSSWISAEDLGCQSGGVCTYPLAAVTPGRKKWRIKARNTAGDSDWSNRVEFTYLR